jgi:hypothetical protein
MLKLVSKIEKLEDSSPLTKEMGWHEPLKTDGQVIFFLSVKTKFFYFEVFYF